MHSTPSLPVVFLVSALAGMPLCLLLRPALRALGLEKPNYRGEPVCSGAGLLFSAPAIPWLWLAPASRDSTAALAVAGFGLLGFIDDLWGTAAPKGFRGHLGALREGQITTGLLKAAGGAALALWVAWRLRPGLPALLAAPLIALAANLFNLLDLRPLRALKVFWLCGFPLVWPGSPLLAQCLGLSLPYSSLESRHRLMLGDTGANALGAAVGVAAASRLPWWAQAGLLLGLAGLQLWAEKHSLTAWIERHRLVRQIDGWGRMGREDGAPE